MFQAIQEPYIIAEIGGNHEGSLSKAKELLCSAAEAGADAVKFQILSADHLVNKLEDETRYWHFKRLSLSHGDFFELKALADSLQVDFAASVWDPNAIALFANALKFFKVGSGDLNAFPILRALASTGKPIILSTGLASLAEIKRSIDYICGLNPTYLNRDSLLLLQCTALYPTPNSDVNLLAMTTLASETGYKIGYSHHTIDTLAAEIAVALGASVVEIHFTDDRKKETFRDHQLSFQNEDLKQLKSKIKMIRGLLGTEEKHPTKLEIESGHISSFRRALFLSRDVCAGEIIGYDDLVALRPAIGISADSLESVVGKKALKNLKTNYNLTHKG